MTRSFMQRIVDSAYFHRPAAAGALQPFTQPWGAQNWVCLLHLFRGVTMSGRFVARGVRAGADIPEFGLPEQQRLDALKGLTNALYLAANQPGD